MSDEQALEAPAMIVGSRKLRSRSGKSLSNHFKGLNGLSGFNGFTGLSQSGMSTSESSSHFGLQNSSHS